MLNLFLAGGKGVVHFVLFRRLKPPPPNPQFSLNFNSSSAISPNFDQHLDLDSFLL